MSSGLSRVESQKKRRHEDKKPMTLLRRGLKKNSGTYDTEQKYLTNKAEPLRRSEKNNNEKDNEHVPSRTDTYSSYNVKVSKIFLNTLIFLFFILTVALLWWGLKGAPPWREIWG